MASCAMWAHGIGLFGRGRYDLARFVSYNSSEWSLAYRQHRDSTNKIDFYT